MQLNFIYLIKCLIEKDSKWILCSLTVNIHHLARLAAGEEWGIERNERDAGSNWGFDRRQSRKQEANQISERLGSDQPEGNKGQKVTCKAIFTMK